MQKIFQWVRDKRHSSVRKWQSSSAFSNHQANDLDLLNDFDKFVATSNPSLNNSSDPAKRTYSVIQHNNGNGTPRTRRRNEAAKKGQTRPSSKSFRSFPPVPIPKKSRRCQEILPQNPTTSAAASTNNQTLLQPPELKREGSWRKLKRKLTPSKRKPEMEGANDKANQQEARPEAGSSGTSSNPLKDQSHKQSSTNPTPKSSNAQRKETLIIVEPCEDEEKKICTSL